MAKTAILHIDLLGVQNMWESGGSSAVKERIGEFNKFIKKQTNYLPRELYREGECTLIIAGDSISVLCQDFEQAIGIGTHFFVQAFYDTSKRDKPFWLRAAISKWNNQYLTVNTQPLESKRIISGKENIMTIGTQYVMEDDYLFVLGLEKSGFKGMRIIINQDLLPYRGRGYKHTWDSFKHSLGYITRLHESVYPEDGTYADVLWMTEEEKRYHDLRAIMEQRFKKSSTDPDEFEQASWTRIMFDQVNTLIWNCQNPRKPKQI